MPGSKSIRDNVRNFLFSNMNKQFLIFAFFLLLSGVFWLIITLNETYEKEIQIPMRVANIPKRVVLISAPVDTVRVTVRDNGWVILNYLYGKKIGVVNANFRTFDKGHGRGSISGSDIRRLIEQQLELSTKIISIKPERLDFAYNNGEYKRVPVRWAGRIIPDQLFFISQVEYMPDSVDIYASRQKLDSIQAIYTEPLNYANFRDSLIVDCRLSHMNDVKVVPERVRIGFYTDVLTEESIDGVPIVCLNLPEGKVLRTFPAKVSIHFVAGVSRIRTLNPEEFTVVADYREIEQEHSEKCNIYLRNVPQGISRATLSVNQVDYLIEEE
ncbi:MAG: YbbR-like domain-containing protein [Prevotella sp.]|nr:YbbR-like domain-containing protein [Prevotella sp.]